jgi:uncharacterized protein (TIGR02246 family)
MRRGRNQISGGPIMTKTLTAAAFLLLAACDSGPTAVGPMAGGAEPLHAQAGAVANGQRSSIQAIVDARAAAWIDKDAAAYAATFANDAVFINPLGATQSGRGAVLAAHNFLFSGPFAGSVQSETIADITFITGTTALVRLNATLTDYAGRPPGLVEAEPGVVRTAITWLVVKQRNEWLIQHQHMTAMQPAP